MSRDNLDTPAGTQFNVILINWTDSILILRVHKHGKVATSEGRSSIWQDNYQRQKNTCFLRATHPAASAVDTGSLDNQRPDMLIMAEYDNGCDVINGAIMKDGFMIVFFLRVIIDMTTITFITAG